jgi:hypothetical protein
MQFPNFTSISPVVQEELNRRATISDPNSATIDADPTKFPAPSTMGAWIRAVSAVASSNNSIPSGLVIGSNVSLPTPTDPLTQGRTYSVYGDMESRGTVGTRWDGSAVISEFDGTGPPMLLRSSPIVEHFEVDEAMGSVSRKATLKIKAFTLDQLQLIITYFLEPGFSVFVEWGWNSPEVFANGYSSTITTRYVKDRGGANGMANVNRLRRNTNGRIDTYLGFVVGGTFQLEEDVWVITTNLAGFVELPTWLQVTDGHRSATSSEELSRTPTTIPFKYTQKEITAAELNSNVDIFMRMFNELPTHVNTVLYDGINTFDETAFNLKSSINYIGFSSTRTERASPVSSSPILQKMEEYGVSRDNYTLDVETRYISLYAVFTIVNMLSSKLHSNSVTNWKVKFNDTYISAFPYMFSHDHTKLFIPNRELPIYDLNTIDTSVTDGTYSIHFPENDEDLIINNVLYKGKSNYGRIENLYMNFDEFIRQISTPKLDVKTFLYNILNYVSSAASGLWNFQLEFDDTTTDPSNIIIVDRNFTTNTPTSPIYEFDLYNSKSNVLEHSFNVDIPSAMMNQVIGNRLASSINASNPVTSRYRQSLFSNGYYDLLLEQGTVSSDDVSPFPTRSNASVSQIDALVTSVEYHIDQITSALVGVRGVLSAIKGGEYMGDGKLPQIPQQSVQVIITTREYLGIIGEYRTIWDQIFTTAGATPTFRDSEGRRYLTITDLINSSQYVPVKTSGRNRFSEIDPNEITSFITHLNQLKRAAKTVIDELRAERSNYVKNIINILINHRRMTSENTTITSTSQDSIEITQTNNSAIRIPDEVCILGYRDINIFNMLKTANDNKTQSPQNVTTMLPVRVSLTMYGISGLRRGDMFRVRGIPESFSRAGFFQIISIKHIVMDTIWTTVIEGAFRRYLS